MQNSRIGYIAAVCLAAWIAQAHAGTYVFVPNIAVPGATQTTPTGIDTKQRVVGYYVDAAGTHGFVLANGAYSTVDYSGTNNTFLFSAISPNGIATGFYIPPGSDNYASFTFNVATSTLTKLDIPPTDSVDGRAVNRTGTVAGVIYTGKPKTQSFRANPKQQTILPPPPGMGNGHATVFALAINSGGVVAGYYSDTKRGPYHGCTFQSGKYTTIDAAGPSNSTSINGIRDDGALAGSYQDYSKSYGDPLANPAFVMIAGKLQVITFPGNYGSGALVITPAGQAVGGWQDGQEHQHAFVWQNGNVSFADVPGSTTTQILGANKNGEFVGTYTTANTSAAIGFAALCTKPPCTP